MEADSTGAIERVAPAVHTTAAAVYKQAQTLQRLSEPNAWRITDALHRSGQHPTARRVGACDANNGRLFGDTAVQGLESQAEDGVRSQGNPAWEFRPPVHYDPPGDRDFVHRHKKQISAIFSVLFATLTLVSLLYVLNPSSEKRAATWARERWVQAPCVVHNVGVAYRGNCEIDTNLHMVSFEDFKECMGPMESATADSTTNIRLDWKQTVAGQCASRGNRLFNEGARLPKADSASRGREASSHAGGNRRIAPQTGLHPQPRSLHYMPVRLECHNSFLPWAAVRIAKGNANDSSANLRAEMRCAYEFGATRPSITGDWSSVMKTVHELEASLQRGQVVPCWRLTYDDCVVAFTHLSSLITKETAQFWYTVVLGGISACFTTFLVGLQVYWFCIRRGHCRPVMLPDSETDGAGFHQPLPTHDPDDVPLSERVRDIWASASAHLANDTPPPSGDASLRGAKEDTLAANHIRKSTGIAATLPRNVAFDFIKVR